MGAWIEINRIQPTPRPTTVAPYMGAWIEIANCCASVSRSPVAPYMGAWIEIIGGKFVLGSGLTSHPTWVRGLKLTYPH